MKKNIFLAIVLLASFVSQGYSDERKQARLLAVTPGVIKMRHAQDVQFNIKNPQADMQLSIMPGGAYIQTEIPLSGDLLSIDKASGSRLVVSKNQIQVYRNKAKGFELVKKFDVPGAFQYLAIHDRHLLGVNKNRLAIFVFDAHFSVTNTYSIQFSHNIEKASVNGSHACLSLASHQIVYLALASKVMAKSEAQAVAVDNIEVAENSCISSHGKQLSLWRPHAGKLLDEGRYLSNGMIREMLVDGNKLILANGKTGVSILAIDDKLRWLGSYNKLGYVNRVAVWQNQVMAADDRGVLTLLNIANVENPLLISDFNSHEQINDLLIEDDTVYALTPSKLMQIDFSANSSPIISTLGVNEGGSRRSFIKDNILYVADWFSGLHLYDISLPRAPRLLSSYHTPGSPKGVVVRGDMAFVADDDHGLHIIDVSNPHRPTYVADLPLAGLAYTMKLIGDRLYIASHRGGFHIVDVSNVQQPRLLGSYDTPGKAWALAYYSGLLYVADDSSGLMVFDVKNPAAPILVSQFNPGGFAEDVVIKEGKAYIAFFDLGLMVLDVSDPHDLKLLATLRTPGNARGIKIAGEYLYLASWEAGVQIIHISDVNKLKIVGHYDTNGATWGVSIKNQVLFAMDWWGGIKVLDVSEKMQPVLLGQYHASGKIHDIAYRNKFIYTAYGARGLQVYDARNGLNPIWATGLDFSGEAKSVALNGNLALVAGGDAGLVIVDVSDPFQIEWLSQLVMPSSADFVQSVGQAAFVGTKNGDLYQIDISLPFRPVLLKRFGASTQAIHSSAGSLFLLNKGGILNQFSVNKLSGGWLLKRMKLQFNGTRLALDSKNVFVSRENGQINQYQFVQGRLRYTTKFVLPEALRELYLHENKLYVTSKSDKLYVFQVDTGGAAKLQHIYPTTHEIERISVSKDGIFFSGESRIASGNLLPDIEISHKSAEYIAKIPANMPLGAYNVSIISADGEQSTFNNAFNVVFPKLKSRFTLEDLKKKLAEKNLPGKALLQP